MKYIFLNLKRFDIPSELGGVNSLAKPEVWAQKIIQDVRQGLKRYSDAEVTFGMYFPELYLYPALMEAGQDFSALLGAQSVYKSDVSKGGNFGAFTSNRTAKSISSIGAKTAMIGHCEERNDKQETMKEVLNGCGIDYDNSPETLKAIQHSVNKILNEEIKSAQAAGLKVLYCVGEKDFEHAYWEKVLADQINTALTDVNKSEIVIAYEPVWAIGPGKVPPDADYIAKIARFIKGINQDIPVVYGGGLKKDNAAMLASIPEIDGGLIALTSFTDPIGFYPEQYLEIIDEYMNNI
ncbi:MAG: triose-phosphate isomerase [Saccharofermentanales bacterium]